jgi:hypothetical protein
MPKFTFTKHSEFPSDPNVTVQFETDILSQAEEHVQDFFRASGFEPITDSYESVKWDKWILNEEPNSLEF